MAKDTAKAQNVASVVAKMKSTCASCSNGVCGKNAVEQRRQRHIDDEEIHPGQRGIGNLLELAAGEADEDQPEIRQREIENVDHAAAPTAPTFGLLGAAFALL